MNKIALMTIAGFFTIGGLYAANNEDVQRSLQRAREIAQRKAQRIEAERLESLALIGPNLANADHMFPQEEAQQNEAHQPAIIRSARKIFN